MKIYLDRNIYEDMRQDRRGCSALIEECQELKKTGNTFFISVIHAEEIATPYVLPEGACFDYIEKEIEFINNITDGMTITPGKYNFLEHIDDLKARVSRVASHIEETRLALALDKIKDHLQLSAAFCKENKICNNEFNSIEPRKIFKNDRVNFLLNKYNLMCHNVKYKSYVKQLMVDVEHLYDFLDVIMYHKIDTLKLENLRSRMYDVAHTIYASNCDILITNDKKMKVKAIAIYRKLGIKTKVLFPGDFFKSIPH